MNTEENIQQILIDDIIPNRFQPRLAFDEEGLKELADSIKQHGIIQPLVLRRLGNKYEIIAGERRYKASIMAGLKTVPAIISNIDDNKSAEIALVENIQRRNLTSIEEAKSYKSLLDRGYLTQTQLAEKMGVSQSTIANKLRLLNLSDEVQKALLEEKISERHARSLLALPKEEQNEWLKKIISKRMTVRQLDLELKNIVKGDSKEMPQAQESDSTILNNMVENIPEDDEETTTSSTDNQPRNSNKFFNFLEDEAANMNMFTEPENTEPTFNVVGPNHQELEILDDFDLSQKNQNTETLNDNIINPLFFNNANANFNNNRIEEISPKDSEELIDPLDRINTLAPDYEQRQKEEAKMDLKTAINDVRDLVTDIISYFFL